MSRRTVLVQRLGQLLLGAVIVGAVVGGVAVRAEAGGRERPAADYAGPSLAEWAVMAAIAAALVGAATIGGRAARRRSGG
jgi:hypothetical protein